MKQNQNLIAMIKLIINGHMDQIPLPFLTFSQLFALQLSPQIITAAAALSEQWALHQIKNYLLLLLFCYLYILL